MADSPQLAVGIIEELTLPGLGDTGDGVNDEHPAYTGMKDDLALVDDLRQGTKRMREQHETYLPKFASEDGKVYERRWKSATLHNAFEETVGMLVGKAFTKPPALGEDVPDDIKGTDAAPGLAEDIDRAGNHLAIFAQDFFKDAWRSGLSHILVDMAPAPLGAGNQRVPMTEAEAEAIGLRPYWVHVKASQVIGWKSKTMGGEQVLTQVRIREQVEEPEGDFGVKTVDQVRVLDIGAYRIFRKSEPGDWTLYERRAMIGPDNKPLTYIPFVTLYTDEDNGFMTAIPPLIDLAYKNIEHFQVHSDYRNCLTVACFPILCISGYSPPDGDGKSDKVAIGPLTLMINTDPQAKVYYAEHTGKALEAARTCLEDIKEDMSMYGLKMILPRRTGQAPTATEEAIGEAKSLSQLQTAMLRMKDCLELALDYTARWLGLGDDMGGSIVVSTANAVFSQADFDLILKAAGAPQRPLIDRKTGILALMAQGKLPEDTDPDEVIRILDQQMANAGSVAGLAGSFLKPQPPAPVAGAQ